MRICFIVESQSTRTQKRAVRQFRTSNTSPMGNLELHRPITYLIVWIFYWNEKNFRCNTYGTSEHDMCPRLDKIIRRPDPNKYIFFSHWKSYEQFWTAKGLPLSNNLEWKGGRASSFNPFWLLQTRKLVILDCVPITFRPVCFQWIIKRDLKENAPADSILSLRNLHFTLTDLIKIGR